MKEFTNEELSSFNGKNGNPAYVAFQGKVYDVTASRLWAKGLHMNRHGAGKDLTGEISAAPHGTDVLERYPRVGTVRKGTAEELQHLPPFLQDLLHRFPMAGRHPHPMVVHFPIALLMAASLFVLLAVLFQKASFEIAGFYLIILGAVSSPFAIATGVLTWWINYRLELNHFIKRKIQLSILLLFFEGILVPWRIFEPAVLHPAYVIVMVLLTPTAALLGYFGGQLVYPSEKSDAET